MPSKRESLVMPSTAARITTTRRQLWIALQYWLRVDVGRWFYVAIAGLSLETSLADEAATCFIVNNISDVCSESRSIDDRRSIMHHRKIVGHWMAYRRNLPFNLRFLFLPFCSTKITEMLYPIGIPTPNGLWAQTKNTRRCVGAEPDVLFYCAYFCLCIQSLWNERIV